MTYLWYMLRTFLGLLLRRPIMGTCVIPIMPDGQVLLMRRRDSGQWGLPGGLMDWGEDIVTSAARELREETTVELVAVERLVGVYTAPRRDPRFHSVCVVMAAQVRGTPQIADPREVLEVGCFPLGELPPGKLSHDHSEHIRAYLEGATVLR